MAKVGARLPSSMAAPSVKNLMMLSGLRWSFRRVKVLECRQRRRIGIADKVTLKEVLGGFP